MFSAFITCCQARRPVRRKLLVAMVEVTMLLESGAAQADWIVEAATMAAAITEADAGRARHTIPAPTATMARLPSMSRRRRSTTHRRSITGGRITTPGTNAGRAWRRDGYPPCSPQAPPPWHPAPASTAPPPPSSLLDAGRLKPSHSRLSLTTYGLPASSARGSKKGRKRPNSSTAGSASTRQRITATAVKAPTPPYAA